MTTLLAASDQRMKPEPTTNVDRALRVFRQEVSVPHQAGTIIIDFNVVPQAKNRGGMAVRSPLNLAPPETTPTGGHSGNGL